MAFVIASACIDCKDGACVQCCPVDCIHEGLRTFYIHPEQCISCGICVSVCPPGAIYEDVLLPEDEKVFERINREFFGAGGHRSTDHPLVVQYPRQR